MPLIDLSQVATEQKGAEYANIEKLPLETQNDILIDGMLEAVQAVKSNKMQILDAVKKACIKLQNISSENRRVCIVGAGTSGRLAKIVSKEMAGNSLVYTDFNIAGGPSAFQKAVEGAEDDVNLAKSDVEKQKIDQDTVVIGVSASGRTPYTIAYLQAAKVRGALTIAIDNSLNSPLSESADLTISNHTGAEFPRGSTRMKAGTSQYATLQIFTKLFMKALNKDDDLDTEFDQYGTHVSAELKSAKEKLLFGAKSMYTHLMDPKNEVGRIVYIGKGSRGLLGAIDGAELGPTYSFTRVVYNPPVSSIAPHDFVFSLDGPIDVKCPQINLGGYDDLSTNIMLKTITTLFALQVGWIFDGEMINLDPKNPNKKLIARRVQILKNLGIAKTNENAMEILKKTNNDLVKAVKLHQCIFTQIVHPGLQ